MSHKILAIGDSYLSTEDMAAHLADLGADFSVRYESVDPDTRPTLDGLREYQGDPREIAGWIADEDVLLVHAAPVTEDLLAARPNIRVVACARGGAVNIDLDAARRLGVTVINTPAKNAPSVADLTMTSIHQLFRGVGRAQSWLREQSLSGATHLDSTFIGGQFLAAEPHGHVLGLVGLGAIGRRVASQARSYGMSVLAHDPYATGDIQGVEVVKLSELLERSDVVSLHAPLTAETRGIADRSFFARMRWGAKFLNTSREGLLDEAALLDALESGQVSGAMLDVCEPDGLWPRFAQMPDVLLTPHLGGATAQTQDRGMAMLKEDLHRWATGEAPLHRIA